MSSRLASCALTSLTRRVGGLSLNAAKPLLSTNSFATTATAGPRLLVAPITALPWMNVEGPFSQTTRTMVTRKKRLARREKRRLESKRAARGDKKEVNPEDAEKAAPQHEAWVDFQKSISISGFQTGQTTKARVLQKGESGQKLRDLKRREKLEMRLATKRAELIDVRGGEYPVGKYSDEETERLLKMAYAAIPPRAGKLGTRSLKRQSRRWFLVRKIHAKKKRQVMAAHFRKMDKRSQRIKNIAAVNEAAPDMRSRDRKYQQQLLARWIQNLKDSDDDFAKQEIAKAEESNQV